MRAATHLAQDASTKKNNIRSGIYPKVFVGVFCITQAPGGNYHYRGDRMINFLIRGLIVYITVITAVRLMGKRQIGQLQPSELVVTILLSEVAAMPLGHTSMPIITCVALVFLLASLEVISSFFSVKSHTFRRLVEGSSVMVIKKGKILQKNLHTVRLSIEDLIEALRLKDVFDIEEVDFAYVETNGAVSVKLKKKYRPPTPDDKSSSDGVIPFVIISEGKIIEKDFEFCGITRKKIEKALAKAGLTAKDVFLMTADIDGNINITEKQVK